MCSIVQDYFGNLFTSELGEPDPIVLADVQRCVTQDMNTGLLAPFSYEEVKKALFQIGDLKGTGVQMDCMQYFLKGSEIYCVMT